MNRTKINSPYKGSGSITREQFLFYEMRITARLTCEGLSKEEIIEKIVQENLFQYPTEKMIKNLANVCIKRLKTLDDQTLVQAIAEQPSDIARQVCLFAMMKQYRLVWDFMITVVGRKYSELDMSFGKIDLNSFFMRLQEQDDVVASWSEKTINKLKQVLTKTLVDNEYLNSTKADHLNPVMISPVLESAIREKNQLEALPAFNCLY